MFNKTNTTKTTTTKSIFNKKNNAPTMTENEALLTSFKTGFCYGVGGVVGTVIATSVLNAGKNLLGRKQNRHNDYVEDDE